MFSKNGYGMSMNDFLINNVSDATPKIKRVEAVPIKSTKPNDSFDKGRENRIVSSKVNRMGIGSMEEKQIKRIDNEKAKKDKMEKKMMSKDRNDFETIKSEFLQHKNKPFYIKKNKDMIKNLPLDRDLIK